MDSPCNLRSIYLNGTMFLRDSFWFSDKMVLLYMYPSSRIVRQLSGRVYVLENIRHHQRQVDIVLDKTNVTAGLYFGRCQGKTQFYMS